MQNKNKRGWIRIVEAFLSVLLVAAVLVLVINQQNIQTSDISPAIYNYEIYMIRSIELNDALRSQVLNVSEALLPVTWNSTDFPDSVEDKLEDLVPNYLLCGAQICTTNSSCDFWQDIKSNIYTQRVFIASTYQNYNPRQLKLFCWAK